jgi:hypothetical protein
MNELKFHELEGIPNTFRRIAFWTHPRRIIIWIVLLVSLILNLFFFFDHGKFENDSLMFWITGVCDLGLFWPTFLLVTCYHFYPSKSYTNGDYALSKYEDQTSGVQSYVVVFLTIYLVFLAFFTLICLIMLSRSLLSLFR